MRETLSLREGLLRMPNLDSMLSRSSFIAEWIAMHHLEIAKVHTDLDRIYLYSVQESIDGFWGEIIFVLI